jgi:hypothetical protein
MVRLKDLFNRAINKNTKQVSYCLKKRLVKEKGIDIRKVLDMELNSNEDFLR